MRRIAAAGLAAATLCGLALGSSSALAVSAADRPEYLIKAVNLYQTEDWRSQERGYPGRCASWEFAEGRATLGIAQEGTRRLTLVSLGRFGGLVGQIGGPSTAPAEARSSFRYRSHVMPLEPPCSPCGPNSEFGPCLDEQVDDVVDEQRCAPAPGLGIVVLGLTGRGLSVGAVPMLQRELGRCPKPTKTITASRMPWRFDTIWFKEAPRRLLQMQISEERTFRREVETGRGCKRLAGVGERSCLSTTTVVTIRRVG